MGSRGFLQEYQMYRRFQVHAKIQSGPFDCPLRIILDWLYELLLAVGRFKWFVSGSEKHQALHYGLQEWQKQSREALVRWRPFHVPGNSGEWWERSQEGLLPILGPNGEIPLVL